MDRVELATETHYLYRHAYWSGHERMEVEWRTCAPRPPWPGVIESFIAVPAQYAAAVAAATKITVDDLEFVLAQTGKSFEQSSDAASEAVQRFENLLDKLKEMKREHLG